MPERGEDWHGDAIILGGGVVGLAIARELAGRGHAVQLLEAADRWGRGLSGRNSGVVHAGFASAPGTRKAAWAVAGRELLWEFCARHRVPHARCGKLVVARDERALAELERAYARAHEALPLEWITPARAATWEPELGWEGAHVLWSPRSGIVDPGALVEALAHGAARAGANLQTGAALVAVGRTGGGDWALSSTRGRHRAPRVVNATGGQAHRVARLFGASVEPQRPCRGDWFWWTTRLACTRLVYPPPRAGAAGLGIHLTVDLDGRLRLGPDVDWDADFDDAQPRPTKAERFARAGAELLGVAIDPGELRWAGCGVRPKVDSGDFELRGGPDGVLHLLGIESPGLTAALAIAAHVGAQLA